MSFALYPFEKIDLGDYVEYYNLPKYTDLLNISFDDVITRLKTIYKLLPDFDNLNNYQNDINNNNNNNDNEDEEEIYFNKTIDLIYYNNIRLIGAENNLENDGKPSYDKEKTGKEVNQKRKPKTKTPNEIKQTAKYKKRRNRNTEYAKDYRKRTSGLKLKADLKKHKPVYQTEILNKQLNRLKENKAYLISRIYEKYNNSNCRIGYIIRKSKIYNSNN